MTASKHSLAQRLLAGDKRALARAITLVENNDPAGWELVREVYPRTGRAAVIGFTGPPGVGKSTLLGALTKHERARERSVAVLSIDPSSPFTNGALLGDRIRLTEHFLDPGVFIRSMASRGALGGLSEAALQAALLMDAWGAMSSCWRPWASARRRSTSSITPTPSCSCSCRARETPSRR